MESWDLLPSLPSSLFPSLVFFPPLIESLNDVKHDAATPRSCHLESDGNSNPLSLECAQDFAELSHVPVTH